MSPVHILLVSLAALALLQFYWIPKAALRLRVDRSVASIAQSGVLAVLILVRSLLGITVLATVAVIVAIWATRAVGGATPEAVGQAIATVQHWRSALVAVESLWSALAIAILAVALGLYAHRSAKRRMENSLRRAFTEELERLREAHARGDWEELPPTRDMLAIRAKLAEVEALRARIDELAMPEAAKTEAREKLRVDEQLLLERLVALDVQRRIRVEIDPDAAEMPAGSSFGERVQTFFMSRGMVSTLGRGSRALFIAIELLLVPSLLAFQAPAVGAALERRIVELRDVQVKLGHDETAKQVEALGAEANTLSEDDRHVVAEAARAFEDALPSPSGMPDPSSLSRGLFVPRAMAVRDRLLREAVDHSGGRLEQRASLAVSDDLAPAERTIVQLVDAPAPTGPRTAAGKRVQADLEAAARRSPSFMERLRHDVRSFQVTAKGADISHELVHHVFAAVTGDGNDLGPLLHGLDLRGPRLTAQWLEESSSMRFTSALLRGDSLSDALHAATVPDMRWPAPAVRDITELQSVMRTAAHNMPIDALNEKLARRPPTVEVRAEPHVNGAKAVEAVEKLIERTGGVAGRGREVADALADYSDWFPGQLGADEHTDRGKLLARLDAEAEKGSGALPHMGGPAGGPHMPSGPSVRPATGAGGVRPSVVDAPRPKLSFMRARSFAALRGFSRVGGVLIGQTATPDAKPMLDVVDFRWTADGPNIRLTLVTRDGRALETRLHNMALVHHAMTYAADGRPLAVTMAQAGPLPELKILLHPTLVDTPLGARVIELDRFVDTYMDRTQRRAAEDEVIQQRALYVLAWAHRVGAIDLGQRYAEPLRPYREAAEKIRQDGSLRLLAVKALEHPEALSDPARSPLAVKTEFFDATLVGGIIAGARTGAGLDGLLATIGTEARKEFSAALERRSSSALESVVDRWLAPPPRFEVWSGVRERALRDVAGVVVPRGTPVPMPFDFMLQVAFTSAPPFLARGDAEAYTDPQPWEFPALRESIQAQVLQKLTARDRQILADVSEFTVLQRLFRLALDGQLGTDFPVEKLPALLAATRARTPRPDTTTRTLRWNANPNIEGQLDALAARGGAAAEVVQLRRALGVSKDSAQILRSVDRSLPPLQR